MGPARAEELRFCKTNLRQKRMCLLPSECTSWGQDEYRAQPLLVVRADTHAVVCTGVPKHDPFLIRGLLGGCPHHR